MKEIVFTSEHRQKHFDFFNAMDRPHFNITANVEITELLTYIKEHRLPTTASMVYVIARAANEIPEFRWRIRGGKVIEHKTVQPSFTVHTEVADVFSFCTVPYQRDAKKFVRDAQEISKAMYARPSLEDEPGRDDYLFLSPIPWIHFTGFEHAMHYSPSDSIPRMVWGKFLEKDGVVHMPLSVQVHHAVADGRHVGRYFEKIEALASNPAIYFE
ncbi:MAG: chloramphenicol acetyltransferase [Bacteroidota bacterium]